MDQSCILIQGGKKLEGELEVQGSKNTVLPVMAASLLGEGVTVLYQVPPIADVFSMIALLEELGCKISFQKGTLKIDTRGKIKSCLPQGKAGTFRGSALLMGALLARNGQVSMEKPGGCRIGKRPLNYHLDGFRRLGVQVKEEPGGYICQCNHLMGNHIYLAFPSVGATENLMLAAAKAYGVTWIHGCAREPEICDLAAFLKKMGAWVEGAGTFHIKIFGRRKLFPTEYAIPYDRIAAATYLMGAMMTEGTITLQLREEIERMENILILLERMGATVKRGRRQVFLSMEGKPRPLQVETGPYPGIPTDIQSMLMAALLLATGPSTIKENIFDARFAISRELNKMGGNVIIEKNCAFILPVKELTGKEVYATDLRGGAALCLAGLAASGETKIRDCFYIRRGYADIVKDFSRLGARIWEK